MKIEKTKSKSTGKGKVIGSKNSEPSSRATSKRKVAKKKNTVSKSSGKTSVTGKKRHHLIQRAAYFLAESGGFSGSPIDHWLQAEKIIDD